MSIPSWYGLVLLGLAAWRTWRLLAEDTVLDGARLRLYKRVRKESFVSFVQCPFCFGFWLAAAWWGAWQLWPHGTLVAAGVMALSAVVGIIGWAVPK